MSLQGTAAARAWPSISVIVPTYREAANLPELIERITRVRDEHGLSLELIIVDDNSRDGTEELIDSLNRQGQSWVKLIVRRTERGLSSAVVRGLEQAWGDVLVVMDADLSHPPEAIPALVERLQAGADFVIGSRYVEGGTTDTSWGLFRWFNSKVATWMARPFTSARDPMAGFFALRRETFRSAEQLNPIGYKIGLELIVKCRCRRVGEVPIHFADRTRGESKLNLREQVRYLTHLQRLAKFRYGRLLRFGALVLVSGAFLVPASRFLPQESYFVDEVTQLTGLALGPVEATRWLAGHDPFRFGVPPDRMPPFSYWVGWGWSQLFGLSEGSMRWLGVLCLGMALIVVFEAARRAWGLRAALAAGLMMALSPNTIVTAVEIRAYPLYVLLAALGFWCLVELFIDGAQRRGRWLIGMAIASLLAMYTHFFGLLLAGALFSAALLATWRKSGRHLSAAPVIASALLVLCAGAGLWPFASAAAAKSGHDLAAPPLDLGEMAKFMYRGLFGHPALATSAIALAAASIAFVVLGAIAILPKRRSSAASDAVLLALVAGMVVATIAQVLVSKFESLNPAYNLWRLPAFALLLGAGLAVKRPGIRLVAACAAILLISASALGAWRLMTHGAYFSHGPHRQINDMIDRLGGPGEVAIIHAGPAPWGKTFFPIRYVFAGPAAQYGLPEQVEGRLRVKHLPDAVESIDVRDIPARRLLVIHAAEQSWRDLAEHIERGDRPLPASELVEALQQDHLIRQTEHHLMVALLAAEVYVFERAEP